LHHNPKNSHLMQGYAVLLINLGQMKEAQKLLIMSVKNNPSHSASWCSLANLNSFNGDLGTARFCFQSAVENDPRSFVALQSWGQLESDLRWGNATKARELFRRALEVSGNRSVHCFHSWAVLEKRQGHPEEAQRLIQQALHLFPGSTRIRLMAIELQVQKGGRSNENIDTVRAMYKDGFESAAAIGDAGFVQSWAVFEQRVLEQQEWQRTVRARKDKVAILGDQEADLALLELRRDLGADLEEATARRLRQVAAIRRLFNKAISLNKYHSASWIGWAKLEQKYGNADVARKLLIAGISNFPASKNIAWFHCALGSLAVQQARAGGQGMSEARACYQRALAASPPQKSLPIITEFASMELSYGSFPFKETTKLIELAKKRFGPSEERVVALEAALQEALQLRAKYSADNKG